jgi:hypothetical protein
MERMVEWRKKMISKVGKIGKKYKEWVYENVESKMRML